MTVHEQHERWVRDVRDPAEAAERETVEHRRSQTRARYDLAPIPTGWAWRSEYWLTDYAGGVSPWTWAATRDQARTAAIHSVRQGFSSHPDAQEFPDVVEVLARLEAQIVQPDLFEAIT